MAKYILNMGGLNGNSSYTNTVDVFKATTRGVTKISNHGLTLSVARAYLAAASCGDYVLAMGGYNGSAYSNTVDVFKVTENGVTKVQNHGLSLSVVRDNLAAVSCGNYILAMGGWNTNSGRSNVVDVFEVTDNGITKVQNHGLALSVTHSHMGSASCGNYILAMGGYTGNSSYTSAVDVFQVTTNGVTKIQNHGLSLSVARSGVTAASCGNYILAMGGSNGSGYLNTIDVFKVTDNGVETVPNHGLALSEARGYLAAASAGNYILAMGGSYGSSRSNAVDVFKVTDNGVETVPNHGLSLSVARGYLAAALAGSYILAMGGNLPSGTYSNAVDVFQCFE